MPASALDVAARHILHLWREHCALHIATGADSESAARKRAPTLFVGLQGPQGSGKSYLASKLPAALSDLAASEDPSSQKSALTTTSHGPEPGPHPRSRLRTVSVSLDDFYLPHSDLERVARESAGNRLLSGRGHAGTHDLQLAVRTLEQFRPASGPPAPGRGAEQDPATGGAGGGGGATAVAWIPVFEKSLNGGRGDRLDRSEWVRVEAPQDVDIVLFEGWMNGFRLTRNLEELYARAQRLDERQTAQAQPDGGKKSEAAAGTAPTAAAAAALRDEFGIDYPRPFFLDHPLEHLLAVEQNLAPYVELWNLLDAFVQLKPERLGYVWEWRLEQEHNMKARNGGVGMTDDQVRDFIARYMPGYELWLPSVTEPTSANSWSGRGVQIRLNQAREAVGTSTF